MEFLNNNHLQPQSAAALEQTRSVATYHSLTNHSTAVSKPSALLPVVVCWGARGDVADVVEHSRAVLRLLLCHNLLDVRLNLLKGHLCGREHVCACDSNRTDERTCACVGPRQQRRHAFPQATSPSPGGGLTRVSAFRSYGRYSACLK